MVIKWYSIGRHMKILVAEDEMINRKLVQKSLLAAGYEVVEAEDGLAAWKLFQQESFQLVITDWMMPGISGPELIHRIRESGRDHYTYILLLTAMDDKENVVTGLESGADEYLTKPFHNRELIARVSSGVRILKLEEQLLHARQQMEMLAMHDGLTGLFNRRAIEEYAEAEFQMAGRKERLLSVILLDIDHFKNVNDQHGHKVGDTTLQHVAKILSDGIRNYDRVGRWGGEEFILILPETQIQDAVVVAERLRTKMAGTSIPLDNELYLSVHISLGVACANGQFSSLAKLIDAADQALYQAKQSGRNRVCTFEQK